MTGYIRTPEVYVDLTDDRIEQTVPINELEWESREIQIRPVGKHHMVVIGTGHQGRNIDLTFSQPQRSDTLAGVDTQTGELIFTGAKKAEHKSNGRVLAHDFPARAKATVAAETNPADVLGTPLNHLKSTQRAHWPRVESRAKSSPLERIAVDESDVPWNALTNPPQQGKYIYR